MRMISKVGDKRAKYFSFNVNKKGSAEDVAWPEIMWIILFVAFVVVCVIFVKNAMTGAAIYEEVYAKKIALIIDGAKSGTDIKLDVTDVYKIALKNKKDISRAKNEIFSIDSKNSYVRVSLGSGLDGYRYYYFSNYDVFFAPLNIEEDGRATIGIKILEKK